jgi:N-acetylglucosamine kinase-like BadF-type ATPase
MRNLARLTNAANNLDSWRDWNALVQVAKQQGLTEQQIAEVAPKVTDKWRKVDKCIAALRELIIASIKKGPPA